MKAGAAWPSGKRAVRLVSALLVASTALALPVRETAAQATVAQRPRIGLALSGGGARGAAHIGVLKVLEAMRVPVDCIAGTSMGAVVGGAYAAGTRPADMEQIIANTDWADVFTDQPPRGEISIRRKEDDYKGFFAPEFGVRDGAILLPKGVVAGVTIEGFLRQLSAPAAGVSDFDRLPIPFRAVATDITTGEEVVLERGSLMRAMRASMAIPGALAPVEIDDRLLVDGGIANNLPIDVVRDLCAADVVIAVNIGTPALTREQLGSALAIVGQLTSFLGKAVVDGQLASLTARDVLIAPELGDISASSFDRQKEAIAIGEAAARGVAGALASYAVPPTEYAALLARRHAAAMVLGQVDEIRFEGIERTNAEVLSALMESKPGTPLNEPAIDADLRRIYGRGDFESVDYRIERGPGRSALVVQVREKSIGPDYLRFGLALASDFNGQAWFNALASYRRTWLNRAGGEWLSEVQIGKDNYLFTEFYQPFERQGRFFVAPYLRISRSTEDIFAGNERIAEYEVTESRAGVDLGATLGTWGEIRLGPMFRDVNARTSTGSPLLPEIDANASGMRLRLFGDRYDFPWFPRSGHRTAVSAFASLGAMGADQDYQRLEASWSGAMSFGRHTFAAALQGGSNLGSDLPGYEAFVLGGPFRLSGYQINQFAGQNSAFASLRYYNQVYRLPSVLGSGIYVGGSLEAGRVGHLLDGRQSTGTLHSASLYLAAETFLGPLFFGVGLAGGGNHAVYLMLGAP